MSVRGWLFGYILTALSFGKHIRAALNVRERVLSVVILFSAMVEMLLHCHSFNETTGKYSPARVRSHHASVACRVAESVNW